MDKSKAILLAAAVIGFSALAAFLSLDDPDRPSFDDEAFSLESDSDADYSTQVDSAADDLEVQLSAPEPSGSLAGVLEGFAAGTGSGAGAAPSPAGPSLDAAQNLALVSTSALRNTFDDASPWAGLSADQISYADVTEPGPMPPSRPSAGIFHENCNFSHFAYDDSIVFPNQPGMAHLHMFFGNAESTAHSTVDSLRDSGASTCAHNELNRSSYWAPAVFTGDHRVLIPEIMNVYYTELDDNAKIVPFPERFQMIQGNAMATEPPTALDDGTWPLYWKCGWHESARRGGPSGGAGQYQGTIPYCDPGTYSHLEMGIQFGHCWDGTNDGTSGDPKSHIQFPQANKAYGTCPAGTSHVPSIRMRIHFKLDSSFGPSNEWYVSSDVRADADGAHSIIANRGASIHADWMNGWDVETLQIAIDTCLNVNRDCWRNFGDARQAKLDPGQSESRTVAYYTGPLVAGGDALDPLCPTRSGRSGPERALCDLSMMTGMGGG